MLLFFWRMDTRLLKYLYEKMDLYEYQTNQKIFKLVVVVSVSFSAMLVSIATYGILTDN